MKPHPSDDPSTSSDLIDPEIRGAQWYKSGRRTNQMTPPHASTFHTGASHLDCMNAIAEFGMEIFEKPRPLHSLQESIRHLRAQRKTCPACDAFSNEKTASHAWQVLRCAQE